MGLREELLEQKGEIFEIAARHGAHRVRVFGSVVRGEETLASDIDLLVEFEPGRSLLDHIALAQDLKDLLGRPRSRCGNREGAALVHQGSRLPGDRVAASDERLYHPGFSQHLRSPISRS